MMEIQKEREDFEKFKAKQIGIDYETLKNDLDDCERRFPNNRYAGWNFKSDWELWQEAKSQAVPECVWVESYDGSVFESSCGHTFELSNDGTLDDNNMKHCCFCGGKIEAQEQSHE